MYALSSSKVLRIQSKAGSFQLKTLSMSSTVGHLRQLIQDQTGIMSDRQKSQSNNKGKSLGVIEKRLKTALFVFRNVLQTVGQCIQ